MDLRQQYANEIRELVEACHRCAELGYVTSHGGNLSYHVAQDIVLITPTKREKRLVSEEEICIVTMKGEVLYAAPGSKPTGELPFHLRIFQRRPDVRGIVHAHPAILTGFAISGSDLLARPILPEPVLEVGPMILVPYAEPLSDQLAMNFDEAVLMANGFLMENHGALMCATEGVMRALDFLQMMENTAQSILVAQQMGAVREIPMHEVKNLDRTMRTRGLPMPGLPGRVDSLVKLYDDLSEG